MQSRPSFEPREASGFARGPDGGGFFPSSGGDTEIHSIVYLFTTGELWLIDAAHAQITQKVFEFDEHAFVETLRKFVIFFESIGVCGPYQWIAGMEGMVDRRLIDRDYPRRMFGTCVADLFEEQGTFSASDDLAVTLMPLFERIFDVCGAIRGD